MYRPGCPGIFMVIFPPSATKLVPYGHTGWIDLSDLPTRTQPLRIERGPESPAVKITCSPWSACGGVDQIKSASVVTVVGDSSDPAHPPMKPNTAMNTEAKYFISATPCALNVSHTAKCIARACRTASRSLTIKACQIGRVRSKSFSQRNWALK